MWRIPVTPLFPFGFTDFTFGILFIRYVCTLIAYLYYSTLLNCSCILYFILADIVGSIHPSLFVWSDRCYNGMAVIFCCWVATRLGAVTRSLSQNDFHTTAVQIGKVPFTERYTEMAWNAMETAIRLKKNGEIDGRSWYWLGGYKKRTKSVVISTAWAIRDMGLVWRVFTNWVRIPAYPFPYTATTGTCESTLASFAQTSTFSST